MVGGPRNNIQRTTVYHLSAKEESVATQRGELWGRAFKGHGTAHVKPWGRTEKGHSHRPGEKGFREAARVAGDTGPGNQCREFWTWCQKQGEIAKSGVGYWELSPSLY